MTPVSRYSHPLAGSWSIYGNSVATTSSGSSLQWTALIALYDRTVESFRVLAALHLGLVNGVFGSFVIVLVAESGSQLCSAIALSVRSPPLLTLQSSNYCRRRALCWCLALAHPRLVCNPRCGFTVNFLSLCLYEWIIHCYSLAGTCDLREDGSHNDGAGVSPHFADQVSVLSSRPPVFSYYYDCRLMLLFFLPGLMLNLLFEGESQLTSFALGLLGLWWLVTASRV